MLITRNTPYLGHDPTSYFKYDTSRVLVEKVPVLLVVVVMELVEVLHYVRLEADNLPTSWMNLMMWWTSTPAAAEEFEGEKQLLARVMNVALLKRFKVNCKEEVKKVLVKHKVPDKL